MSLEKRLAIFTDVMTIVSYIDCSISAILIHKDQMMIWLTDCITS